MIFLWTVGGNRSTHRNKQNKKQNTITGKTVKLHTGRPEPVFKPQRVLISEDTTFE